VQVGDVITAVNGEKLAASGQSVNAVVERVKASGASAVHFDITRRGQEARGKGVRRSG
jgi:C-terminal processing protease CtpA/Prc